MCVCVGGGGGGEGTDSAEGGQILRRGDRFCGGGTDSAEGGTESASGYCLPGQNPLADSVRGDNIR